MPAGIESCGKAAVSENTSTLSSGAADATLADIKQARIRPDTNTAIRRDMCGSQRTRDDSSATICDQMRIAIATCREVPAAFADDLVLARELKRLGAAVDLIAWDAPTAWGGFEAVVVRSTWDYTSRHEEFVAWAETVGERLHNSPAAIRWNTDKRYLRELADAGLPVVETLFVEPGGSWPGAEREVVIKPNVSMAAQDTGRFRPEVASEAAGLIEAIHRHGRVAMVQPFQPSVESEGETALVFFDGRLSHSLRKRAVLRPDEVAPMSADGIRVAEVMYHPELVLPGRYEPDELDVAERVLAYVADRLGSMPLYARVDMLRDEAGAPILLEIELVEPNLYFDQVPAAAARLAGAVLDRL